MAKKIKCIVKRPDEQFGHVTWISDSLENLQKTVGGYIETVTFNNELVLICNEEGKLRDMPYNFTLRRIHGIIPIHNPIFGTVIACGAEEDQLTDVPIDFNEWKALLCEWGELRKENDMKRYAIVYLTESGSAKLLTVDATDESDARKQFWELYEGLGFTIRCVAQI